MQKTKQIWSVLILLVLATSGWAQGEGGVRVEKHASEMKTVRARTAREIINTSGFTGGLVVHVGPGDGAFTSELFANDRCVVQGLYSDGDLVGAARKKIAKQGLYGKVSVRHWDKDYLPYADNLVNLLVVAGPGDVSMDDVFMNEAMRVLAPLGSAFTKSGDSWARTVKPWPKEIDEWTHYLHGPDNNAVAQDKVVGLPRRVQWIGFPKFARSHDHLATVSAMVSARGRLFYIIDEGLTSDIRMPPRWRLVARDAFNGTVLWKRSVDRWTNHLRRFRSGPPDLPFRLVAVGERVYVALGEGKPVVALEAASGKTVTTYKGSENARQIIRAADCLIVQVGVDRETVRKPPEDGESVRASILASNPETGERLWRKEINVGMFSPLVVSGDALLYQTRERLVCLELKTGDEKWRKVRNVNINNTSWASLTLTAHKNIVYVADFSKLTAFPVEDGAALWECSSAPGFASPPDIFVINDLLWRGYTKNRGSADFGQGLNARTGKIEKTIATEKAWEYPTLAHHRCYRPKATSRFILSSRSGVEFIDVESGKIDLNHAVRGTCQYGVMPSNGLLYAPPHSCACNIKTMAKGIYAFGPPARGAPKPSAEDSRFEKGPAYESIRNSQLAINNSSDWPTFRHDNARSARTASKVPHDLRQMWTSKPGGRLSSPVASDGKVFVAAVDTHTVHALDAASGASLWSHTGGGRIDSPPTIYKNRVFFGSADGWVTSLLAADGALVWRFRAAPEERTVMVRGQLESAWPIHGSVLIKDDTLIVAAGRSSYLDGGITVYRLDPSTGKKLSQTTLYSLDAKTGEQPDGGVDLRGVLNDVLSVSGGSVYMRHLKINFETGDDLGVGPPHLFAPTGFLDDTWWHRSYWIYGSDPVCMPPVNESGWQIWPRVGNMVPSGRILSLGEETVYGYGRDKYPGGGTGQIVGGEKYHLFAAEKRPFEPLPSNKENQHLRYGRSGTALGLKVTERDKQHGAPGLHRNLWSQTVPVFVRALALADTTLLLAGPPERAEMRSDSMTFTEPDKAEAAFLGRQGASLLLVDAAEGKQLAEYELESSPVFDGMIAARGRIFVSLENGSIVCFGKYR